MCTKIVDVRNKVVKNETREYEHEFIVFFFIVEVADFFLDYVYKYIDRLFQSVLIGNFVTTFAHRKTDLVYSF